MIKTTMKKNSCTSKNPKMEPAKKPTKCQASSGCCSAPKKPVAKETIVKVLFDCGFPNILHIRGEGISTLSWDKGSPMQNVSANEWVWKSSRPCTKVQFKILINDELYEVGENHVIGFGDALTIRPNF